jgi:DNA-binding MarR family transcriptional regulator
MQLDALQALIRMFVERILEEVFPGETGSARMQQIALFTLILMLQNSEPVTATRIAEMTGQMHSQIHRNLQKLLKLGIVERTRVKNRLGRGQAWHLSVKHTPETQKLLDAVSGGFKKGRRPRPSPK